MKVHKLLDDAFHVEGFISTEEASFIYDFFGENVKPEEKQRTGTIGYGGWNADTGTEELQGLRRSIDLKIKNLAKELYGLDLRQSSCLYKRMLVGDGHTMHIDNPFKTNMFNQYVGLLMINDDYEGGEFRFPLRDVSVFPRSGDLIMFMGDERMAHEVGMVTKGNRDNVVMYYHDPKEVAIETESVISLGYVWDSDAPYGVRLKNEYE